MSWLNQLLGRDDTFFRLLEASSNQAKLTTGQLSQLLPRLSGDSSTARNEIAISRQKHKVISREITEALCKVFMTPIEPEDIEALNSALYKISKNVEKIAERLSISPAGVNMETVGRQLELLGQAGGVVAKMVAELRDKAHGEDIKGDYERLQAIEAEADRIMNELLSNLYRDVSEARVVVFWKDIYELLEKAIDRCRDAGYVVFHVALKNA
ncbi:MAG: DUF47 family protein [Verrucomicrobia bacterium]|nr:DUF47 family protein [Verrucomicrobiota bacterium]